MAVTPVHPVFATYRLLYTVLIKPVESHLCHTAIALPLPSTAISKSLITFATPGVLRKATTTSKLPHTPAVLLVAYKVRPSVHSIVGFPLLSVVIRPAG